MKAVSRRFTESSALAATLRGMRIPFIQRATLSRGDVSEDLFLVDLGVAGVFAERAEPLPVGERVILQFRLPGNEIPLVAHCRVAWWHPPGGALVSKALPAGIGLAFVELPEDDRRRLWIHLEEYLGQQLGRRRFHRARPLRDEDGEDGEER